MSIVQPAGASNNSRPSVIEGYKHVKQIFSPHPAKTAHTTLDHTCTYGYDMRSQLTSADITNIIGTGNWSADYSYHKNGDMAYRTIQGSQSNFTYNGNLMATLDGTNLLWDENGQLTVGASAETLSYNWDGKLRSATKGTTTINLKYDPSGNRIYKNSGGTARKYIIDIVGGLPVILVELEGSTVKKKYVYANGQILKQYDTDTSADYFYLHDRLGSVRQLINTSGNVVKLYTYEPFGKTLEEAGTLSNPFRFTGQFYDSEIDEYYLRARQYDPLISRFTSRDPVLGDFKEPLTLHAYLYCINDPVNKVDPQGRFAYNLVSPILTGSALYAHTINLATYAAFSGNWDFFDLAKATSDFIPVGMTVASVGVRTLPGYVTGFAMGLTIEELTHITGMGRIEGAVMDYWAYLLYGSYMLKERVNLGIWPGDMQEFTEWRGAW